MYNSILLVEDNSENLGIFATILRHYGYRVVEARSGRQALDLAAAEGPDLILLDLGLPDIDGFEVLARLRKEPTLALIPVLVVSANATQRARDQSLALGARRFLTKPIRPSDLVVAVGDELQGQRKLAATGD